MRTIKITILCLLAALAVHAQQFRYTYSVGRDVASGTSNVLTFQMPTNATKTFKGIGVAVACGAACDIQIERDGTAATTTAATIKKTNPEDPTPETVAYHTSNVGSGTALPGVQPLFAAGVAWIDLSDKRLVAGQNVTIRVTAGSATRLTVNGYFEEF